MPEVHKRVIVADLTACRSGGDGVSVVHACKSPCHQHAVGYRGNLSSSHPNYLYLRRDSDLYLNIIDPPIPLFPDTLFSVFMSFARENWDCGETVLIHCNKGESRAPSLALIFLAKGLGAISNDGYANARADFVKLYPTYMPGKGIEKYLTDSWTKLDAF